MAEGIPVTRIEVPMSRINAIRDAVCRVTHLGDGPDASRLACPEDAPALLAFLSVRSIPESSGAFFGVDWLLLALVFIYLQVASHALDESKEST